MKLILLVCLICLTQAQLIGPLDCGMSVLKTLKEAWDIYQDFKINGPFFKKQRIVDTFNQAKLIFKYCPFEEPIYLKLTKCVQALKENLDSIDLLADAVDKEDYDLAWDLYQGTSIPSIKMANICTNSFKYYNQTVTEWNNHDNSNSFEKQKI